MQPGRRMSFRTSLLLIVLACVPATLRAEEPTAGETSPPPIPRLAARLGSSTFRHESPPYWATYAGPDNQIFTLAPDSQLRIWEAASGRELWATEFSPPSEGKVGISPDASQYLWVDGTGVVRLRARGGEIEGHELVGLRAPTTQFSFSGDGTRVAALALGSVAVWQVRSGKLLAKVDLPVDTTAEIWLDAKGETLLAAGGESLWRVDVGGKSIAEEPLTRPGVIRLCGHGTAAWFTSEDTLELVDGVTGKTLGNLKWTVGDRVHEATTPDRSILVLGFVDGTVTAWEVASGKQLWSAVVGTGSVTSLSTSPDNSAVAITTESSNFVHQRDIRTGEPIAEADAESGVIYRVAASPDGKSIATFAEGGSISVWNRATGHLAWRVKAAREEARGLEFSPSGSTLLLWLSGETPAIQVFRTSDGSQARLQDPERGPAGWSEDGKHIARFVKRSIVVCDAESWKEEFRMHFPSRRAGLVALAEQGKTLVYLSASRDDGDGEPGYDWSLRTAPVTPGGMPARKVRLAWALSDTAFSADREMLAIRRARTTEVWDVRTGIMLFTVAGGKAWLEEDERVESPENGRHARGRNERPHPDVLFVAWNPDGTRLASTRAPGRIDIIDTRLGDRILTLEAAGASACGAFVPGTDLLATGGEDGTLRLWDVSTPPPAVDARKNGPLWHVWDQLGSLRGSTARHAAAAFASSGDESLAWLLERLDFPEAAGTAELIKGLGSDNSTVRDESQARLLALGPGVEPALRRARDAGAEPEVRARIDVMLATFSDPTPHTKEDRQRDWAVRIIGEMGTTASRAALTRLSTGSASGRVQGMAAREIARREAKPGK
ncbi:MAG: WD40 repeat domain-containing protein [Planctomycetes bacterium]|nr:WD40 repeat domain-containing protein [Planctomycetota bacterium]